MLGAMLSLSGCLGSGHGVAIEEVCRVWWNSIYAADFEKDSIKALEGEAFARDQHKAACG